MPAPRSEPERIPEVAEAAPEPVVATADAPLLLHGFVRDPDGAPVAGASVSFEPEDGRWIRAESDAGGRWSVATFERGTHLFRASKRNHETAEATVALDGAGDVVRRDFVLVPQQVVRVDLLLPDGGPAMPAIREAGVHPYSWGLVPVATREDPGATFTDVGGSLNNRFGIGQYWGPGDGGAPNAGPETYGFVTLLSPAPAWISLVAAHQVLAKRAIEPSTTEVTFIVSPGDFGNLEGRVVARVVSGEDGLPLTCTATVMDDPFPRPGKEFVGGSVDLPGQQPGLRYLVVQAPDRAAVIREVLVERGRTTDVGEIRMHAPVSIAGRIVTDVDPLPTAVLRWGRVDPATGRVAWKDRTMQKTDHEGRFVLDGLEPGVWMIRVPGLSARPPRGSDDRMASATVRVDATAGSVEGVELVLASTARVTLVTGKVDGDERYVVRAFDADGRPSDSARVGKYASEADLALTPGDWELVLTLDGEELERRGVAVTGEALRIDWPLE